MGERISLDKQIRQMVLRAIARDEEFDLLEGLYFPNKTTKPNDDGYKEFVNQNLDLYNTYKEFEGNYSAKFDALYDSCLQIFDQYHNTQKYLSDGLL